MKRSLSSLIESTDVREFKVVDIEVEKFLKAKRKQEHILMKKN